MTGSGEWRRRWCLDHLCFLQFELMLLTGTCWNAEVLIGLETIGAVVIATVCVHAAHLARVFIIQQSESSSPMASSKVHTQAGIMIEAETPSIFF